MKNFKKHLKLFTIASLVLVGALFGLSLLGISGKALAYGLPMALAVPALLGVTTTDLTGNSKKGAIPMPGQFTNPYIISNTVTIPSTAATNDIVNALAIKKGTLVISTFFEIITAGVGTAAAVDLGDGDNATGYVSNSDATAAAGTVVPCPLASTYAAAGGKYYSADDTIDVKCHTITAMTTAPTLKVTALCVDIHDFADYTSVVVAGNS